MISHEVVFIVPQNEQVQKSGDMPHSPHVRHVHPKVLSTGRVVRHASHCNALALFNNVHTEHSHSSVLRAETFCVCSGGALRFKELTDPFFTLSRRVSGDLASTEPLAIGGSSITMTSSSLSLSPVRSITLSSAALAASSSARAPCPHIFSSRALRSAA